MIPHFMSFANREFNPIEFVPKKIRGYFYQPFLGTEGVVHLMQNKGRVILSDYDKEFFLLFRHLKNDYFKLDYFLDELTLTHSKGVYNQTKKDFLMFRKAYENSYEQSARFLYLLHYGKNYAINRKFYYKRVLKKWHAMLNSNVEIMHMHFATISPRDGDFVYLEPMFYERYCIGKNVLNIKDDDQIKEMIDYFICFSKKNIKMLLVGDKSFIAKVKRACRHDNVFFESKSFDKTGWVKNYITEIES